MAPARRYSISWCHHQNPTGVKSHQLATRTACVSSPKPPTSAICGATYAFSMINTPFLLSCSGLSLVDGSLRYAPYRKACPWFPQ
jgi:hypothetical protein